MSNGPGGMLARRGLTGRALALGVVLLVLVLMLAAPVQRYLAHRESDRRRAEAAGRDLSSGSTS